VSRDRRPDLVVGVPGADNNGRENSGSAYVVYGPFRPDTSRPRLVLRARSPQHLTKPLWRSEVRVVARCSERCQLSASGTIRILGRKARLSLQTEGWEGLANHNVTLELGLSPEAASRLARFLKRGERARASLTVRCKDRAGNARSASRIVALKR
jgi:hypothetical protein